MCFICGDLGGIGVCCVVCSDEDRSRNVHWCIRFHFLERVERELSMLTSFSIHVVFHYLAVTVVVDHVSFQNVACAGFFL